MDMGSQKCFRMLLMYEKLCRGEVIYKKEIAEKFGVDKGTVLQDIDDLRTYMAEFYAGGNKMTIAYDYINRGYILVKQEHALMDYF